MKLIKWLITAIIVSCVVFSLFSCKQEAPQSSLTSTQEDVHTETSSIEDTDSGEIQLVPDEGTFSEFG